MAACRMASKGKSMADSGYDAEVKSIQAFLSMQVMCYAITIYFIILKKLNSLFYIYILSLYIVSI